MKSRDETLATIAKIDGEISRLSRVKRSLIASIGGAGAGFSIEKLGAAVIDGGPLFNGAVATGRVLREVSREWRRLIEALTLDNAEPRKMQAEKALELIGVTYFIEGSTIKFFTL